MTLLAIACVVAVRPDNGPTADQAALLQQVNVIRAAHRLEPLSFDPVLSSVAVGHARYMADNRILTHVQNPVNRSFIGQTLADRVGSVGWERSCSELVGYATTQASDSVQAIFDSPCHRSRFLYPGALALGSATNSRYVCLIVGGSPDRRTVVSPPQGAQDVPVSWRGKADLSGTHSFGRQLGYPLLVIDTSRDRDAFTDIETTLVDSRGNLVPHLNRNPENDRHYTNSVAVIPEQALAAGETYTATVQFSHPDQTVSWSFQTRP